MKKILAHILALVMLLSCVSVPTAAADEEVKAYITEAEYGFVNAMGSTYGYDYSRIVGSVLTRGQVCRVISYFGNFKHGGTPTEYEALFHDLSTDDYYYPYIKACYEGGIIKGFPDGTFRSAEPMTTKDVARLLAYCIGYKEYINVAGLESVLNKTGIMDGVPVTDAATQDMIYKMMYNAYHAPACIATAVSSTGDVEYSIGDDYLGMELLEKVRYAKGIVDGAVGTTLESPDDSMTDGLIAIDGTRYEYDGDATALLGYHVEYYYQTGLNNKTDGNKIIYASKTSTNKEFVIKDADLDNFENFTYNYYKGNKAESIEIREGTDVIMNGIANPTYTNDDMVPLYGEVVLIDNDKTTPGYDVAKIESYEFFLVDNVDLNKKIIYDQSEEIDALNMEEADVINIKWDGEDYPMERIIYGNFLKVKRTNPNSGYYLVDIEVLKNEKNSVTVLSANDDVVNENGMSHTLWTNLSEESREYLEAGKVVTLYFSDGVVVRVEGAKTDDSIYGYLMHVASEGVLNPTISFRIMTDTAEPVVYEMAGKVKIDGESYADYNDIFTALFNSAQASNNIVYTDAGEVNTNSSFIIVDPEAPLAQMIKYKINASGKLISVDTIVDGDNEDEDSKLTIMEPAQGRYYKDTSSGNIYESSGKTHLAGFSAASARFMVPLTGRNDEDNYKVFDLLDANTYTFQMFDVDEDIHIAKAGVVYVDTAAGSSTLTRHYDAMIVTSLETTLDENDEAQVTMNCVYRKTTKTYVGKPEKFAGIDVGDVVRAVEDKYGKVEGVELVFDVSEPVPLTERYKEFNRTIIPTAPTGYPTVPTTPYTASYAASYGTVIAIKDGFMRFTVSTVDDPDNSFDPTYYADNISPGSAQFWKYSNVRGVISVEPATQSDIVTYVQNSEYPSKVIVNYNHNGGGLNQIYILEVQED